MPSKWTKAEASCSCWESYWRQIYLECTIVVERGTGLKRRLETSVEGKLRIFEAVETVNNVRR